MSPKPCAVFLWTHRGLDRPRITNDTPLETALAESQTMRAQFDAAQRRASINGWTLAKTFMLEETGHLPTDKVFPTVNRAISWCRANDAPLIMYTFRGYRERGFTSYNAGLYMDHLKRRNPDVCIEWLEPTQEDISLHEYFCESKRREKLRRRHIKASRTIKERIATNAFTPRYLLKSVEIDREREKGHQTQSQIAASKARTVLSCISRIMMERTPYGYDEIAVTLNILMQDNDNLRPRRAKRWTEANLRRYANTHRDLWTETGFRSPNQF